MPLSLAPRSTPAGLAILALALATTLSLALLPRPAAAADEKDFSPAERLLFMTPQLAKLKPPQTLRYAFRKSGSLEPGYDDSVALFLSAQADGSCCAARSEFLSGERQLKLPELPAAEGNPVILSFLEHDIREMQRLTKGSQNHFRQRIRMSVYSGATVSDVSVRWRGQAVAAKEIRIAPYLDDPNRARFPKFATKEYRFVLSDAVPGGVYAIRSRIPAEDGAAVPLIVEALYAEGAETVEPAESGRAPP